MKRRNFISTVIGGIAAWWQSRAACEDPRHTKSTWYGPSEGDPPEPPPAPPAPPLPPTREIIDLDGVEVVRTTERTFSYLPEFDYRGPKKRLVYYHVTEHYEAEPTGVRHEAT